MVPRRGGALAARRSSHDKRTRPSSVTPKFHVSRAASSLSRARTALARSSRGSTARAASAQLRAVGRSIAGRVASFSLAVTSGGRRIHGTRDSNKTITIVATRALHSSAPDRTAGPTEQMRAQEIPADTPDHEEHGHRADDSQFHEELQEVVVGHAHVDLAGLEHRWLVVPVDVSVCAETD